MIEERLQQYRELIDKANSYYTSDEKFIKYFNRVPKSRYHTFRATRILNADFY